MRACAAAAGARGRGAPNDGSGTRAWDAQVAWESMDPSVSSSSTGLLPVVDYALVTNGRRDEFLRQLTKALSDVGFLVLKNAPGTTIRHFFQGCYA